MSDSQINDGHNGFEPMGVTSQNGINKFSVWGFIKGFGKLVIGFLFLIQGLIGLFFLLALIGVFSTVAGNLGGNNDKAQLTIANDSAFLFNPRGIITEVAPPQDNLEAMFQEAYGVREPRRISLSDAVKTIRAARDDKRIKAMVLDLDNVGIAGTSKAYALIDEIKAFKEADKKVYAVGNYFGQTQYLIASHADEILLNKSGAVSIYGYGVYRNYYKSLLEKLKITSHVFRVGTYKAAVEPQLRDDMSPAAKEANLEFVGELGQRYIREVGASRGLNAEDIHQFADEYHLGMAEFKGNKPEAVKALGLVDQVTKPSDMRKYLAEIFGAGEKKKDYKHVSFDPYLRSLIKRPVAQANKIAVVTAAGAIMPGKSRIGQTAGSTTIVKFLDQARKDDKIKAVVLRVDSPGGSAFASELIHDALTQIKEAGKPVIVSMGSLAASGGYLISAPADEIWASPSTITGSIGIFASFSTFENLAAEIGVNTDGVGTTSQAAILGAGIGALPETTASAFQSSVEHGYDSFLSIVAEGRGLEKSYVDSVGQGRVWTGQKALELKLVDKLGTLDDAIVAAAKRANIEDYEVTRFQDRRTPFEKLFGGVAAKAIHVTGLHKTIARHRQSGIGEILRAYDKHAEFLSSFDDPNHLYLRCLECEGITQ